MSTVHQIRRLAADEVRRHAGQLGELLLDAVDDGASLGFLAQLTAQRAQAFWRGMAQRKDGRAVFVAHDARGIAGAVMVVPAAAEVQPHRAEIAKLVVHRRARGTGLARRLLYAAERHALESGRWHLSLMTRRGCPAEAMYQRLGWSLAGIIPADSLAPEGALCDGAIYYRKLRPGF